MTQPPKPSIDAGDRKLERITPKAWSALGKANNPPRLFRYAGVLSRIEPTDDGVTILRPLNHDRLRHELARAAEWFVMRDTKGRCDALPPDHVVRDMLADPSSPLPVIRRIVGTPVFGPDGTLMTTPGYDPESKIYYSPPPGLSVVPVPRPPGQALCDQATAFIQSMYTDFPFTGEAERAHAMALFLLPFARELIDGSTPLHLIEKPTPGTGGSLLAEVLSFPSVGSFSTLTEARDEAEWRKRITAKLMQSPAWVIIDNLNCRLESAAVSAAITTPVWEDRLLGQSEIVRVPVHCAWVATGNNPALSAEIARRTVRIRLNAKTDRPWLRGGFVHPNLPEWVRLNRGDLVRSALIIIQHWISEGRPAGDKILGRFDSWSRVLGGILGAAKIPGFLENLDDFYEESDRESETLGLFLQAWWNQFGSQEVGVKELYAVLHSPDGPLIDLDLGNGNDHSKKIQLGIKLGAARDRQFGSLQIIRGDPVRNAHQWRLVQV